MKTGGLEFDLTTLYSAQDRFSSVNNSIVEEKSLSSGFNLVQPSIKMVRWLFRRLGEFKSENESLFCAIL